MEQVSRIGMDTSKHIFQLHGVNAAIASPEMVEIRRGREVVIGRVR